MYDEGHKKNEKPKGETQNLGYPKGKPVVKRTTL